MLDINSSGSACTIGSIIPFLVKSKISLLIASSSNLENFIGDETKFGQAYQIIPPGNHWWFLKSICLRESYTSEL